MSSELRMKKLRGSGGYVMAVLDDTQQAKGSLGGADLFLAPVGRLDENRISKYYCNTCEKEFEGSPKIMFENPNEVVAENLVLVEKGKYVCGACSITIAEYREFRKQKEEAEIGNAKPEEPQVQQKEEEEEAPVQVTETTQKLDTTRIQEPAVEETRVEEEVRKEEEEPVVEEEEVRKEEEEPVVEEATISVIEGKAVYDENANKLGTVKQIGIEDTTQTVVMVITKSDGTSTTTPWINIKKIGEVILLGDPEPVHEHGECEPVHEHGECEPVHEHGECEPVHEHGECEPVHEHGECECPGKCPNCKFDNNEGSKFCEECGTQL